MSDTTAAARVADAIVRRRNRDRHLPGQLFGDPAWEALLEFYAADTGGKCIGLAELAERLGATESLARRWTDILLTVELLVRKDGDLAISPEGKRKIEKIFG